MRLLVAFGIGLMLAAGCSSSSHRRSQATPTTGFPQPPGPPRTVPMFGHIASLKRHGRYYEMRFDPALLLQGATARRAATEDKVIPPGDVVTNDFYIREDEHKLLTFIVQGDAKVTVVTSLGSTPIHVFELAHVVSGHRPKRQGLNPRLGFWAYVATDTVRRLDQQYLPCPRSAADRSRLALSSGVFVIFANAARA